MYGRLFLDSELVHDVYNPGPALARYTYTRQAAAGGHKVKVGMYTNNICSGTFPAYHDDIMVGRTTNPAPQVSYAPGGESEAGCMQ
jgi:hypothetical protein